MQCFTLDCGLEFCFFQVFPLAFGNQCYILGPSLLTLCTPLILASKHLIKMSAYPFYADDIQFYILFDPHNGLLCVTTHVVVFMVSVLCP